MATLNAQQKVAAGSASSTLLPLPLTPLASINTNWTNIAATNFAICMSAAPDSEGNSEDTLWVGTASGLMIYSIVNSTWTTIAPDIIALDIAAISATEAYIAAGSGSLIHFINGQSESMPAVPGGDVPSRVAAAGDGTLWAAGPAGCYLWNGSGWLTTNLNGQTLNALATTGANGAWAVGNLTTLLSYSADGGWQPVPEFANQWIGSVGAAPDGSVWIAGPNNQPFQVLQSDGSWLTVPMSSPGDLALSTMKAASRYRCYVLWFSGFLSLQLSCLSFGVVDQAPVSFPAMTPTQTSLYAAISQFLLTTPAGNASAASDAVPYDIRTHYNDTLANLETWYTNLKTETWAAFIAAYPGDYSEDDWNVLQPQLLTELSYAEEVNALFTNINDLNQAIENLNNTAMQSIPGMVGLAQPNGPDDDDTVLAILGGVLQALMWGLSGVGGLGEVLGFAMGAAASALGSGLDAMGGSPPNPGDRSQQITTTYYNLTQNLLLGIYKSAALVSGNSQAAIVQDWGMLNLVGNASFTGLWNWPDQESSQIAAYAQNAYEIWFFQMLMTAKWEVVYLLWLDEAGPWNSRTPDYCTYTEPNIGMGGTDTYFSLEIGGDANVYNPPEMGPFPAQELMNAIWALGVQPADFYKNQNGWINPQGSV